MNAGKRPASKEQQEADETPRPLSDRQPGTLELDTCPVAVEGATGWVKSENHTTNLLGQEQALLPEVWVKTAGTVHN